MSDVTHTAEERYRLLVEGAKDYAMVLLDPEGRVTSWNVGAERILGWTEAEVLGQSIDLIFTPEDRAADVPAREIERARAEGRAMDLRWHLKADDSRFYADGIMECLWDEAKHVRGFAKIMRDATERHRTEEALAQHVRHSVLAAEVGRALTTGRTLANTLGGCVEAMITHLDAAFARVWILDEAQNVLVLRASAGQYTHLDGPHSRIPVGQFKIGLIAQERRPHLTNAVVGDLRVSDQEWARREGMVAFAGYPLLMDERLVGVVALFARHPLHETTLQALASVADQIAVGIDRERYAAQQRAFLHDVLLSVTEGHLHLCHEPSDLPSPLPAFGKPIPLSMTSGIRHLRHLAEEAAVARDFAEKRWHDLVTAASEAAMNAVVHAGRGQGSVCASADMIQVWVEDEGKGIDVARLPRATLQKGYSSAGTLGHGMKMMLETADRVFLLTGPTGTTVVLEQDRAEQPLGWL